jgi:hypothetical protein
VAAPDEGLEAEEEQVPAELDDSVQAAEVVLRLPDPVVH